MIYLLKTIKFFLFCIIFLFGNLFVKTNHVIASEEKLLTQEQRKFPSYRLGPGDKLDIKFFGLKKFNSTVIILPDGTINLPRVGSLKINGLTLLESKNYITNAYSGILRRPIVYLDLIKTRPIKISITGEVRRPGIYSMDLENENILVNNDGQQNSVIKSSGWPTLVDAIQKGGGITEKGNLRDIRINRRSKINSKMQTIKVDYWQSLKSAIPVDNYYLYDGDSIMVPPAKDREENELFTLGSSNFSTSSINVNVVGEILNPGSQRIKTNSPLSRAILQAGGLTSRSNKNQIYIIRFNKDGTITKKTISYNSLNSSISKTNPYLKDGDLIVVGKNSWATATDTINTFTAPINPLIPIYRLLRN